MRAEFKRKETSIEAQECVVEKVIQLSQEEYVRFANALWLERDFIRENKEAMRVEKGIWHCLLVVEEGVDEGILVQSEGADYARYTSFVPSVAAILQQVNQMELEEKMGESEEMIGQQMA